MSLFFVVKKASKSRCELGLAENRTFLKENDNPGTLFAVLNMEVSELVFFTGNKLRRRIQRPSTAKPANTKDKPNRYDLTSTASLP
jgi:hypothetical protein